MDIGTLLIVGDSPILNSGFAKVVQNLARRWKTHFKRIDFWAINHVGYPGQPGKVDRNEWMRPPFVLYPAHHYPEEPWSSVTRLNALLKHIRNGDYTHVFVIQDHFLLAQHGFPKVLRNACEATVSSEGVPVPQKKSYFYIPVDAPIDQAWIPAIEAFDFPVAYTEYGRQEILKWTGIPDGDAIYPNIRVLPHGVDTAVYHPIEDREKMRIERSGGWIRPGDIVLINCNANQRRKDTVRSLELIAELHKRDPRFKLIMHMNAEMPRSDGINIKAVAAQLGLTHGVEWQCTDDGKNFAGIIGLLTEEDLNVLYNCADIYLTTSLGEGWGLGITEALAAGLTIASPDHTACAEIADGCAKRGMTDRFIKLPLEPGVVVNNLDNNRARRRVDVEKAANLIEAFVASGWLYNERTGLNEYVQKWLSWDRIANQWLELFQAPKPARRFFIEVYGGLGDAYNTLYHRSAGKVLEVLEPKERATVALYTNNPAVPELFKNHPKRDQIDVIDLGLHKPGLSGRWEQLVINARNDRGLPPRGALDYLPDRDATELKWYPSAGDRDVLQTLPKVYLVVAPSAGLIERNLPSRILLEIQGRLQEIYAQYGVSTCWTGRTYERHGREEIPAPKGEWCIDLIDRLSAAGSAALLQNSVGLITCHSALNPLAWRMRKPQLLLYPDSVYDRHYAMRDQWAFGIDDPMCVHGLFKDYSPEMLENLFRLALGPLYR